MLAAFAVFWIFSLRLEGLVIGVILLDAGMQAAQVANLSRILGLVPYTPRPEVVPAPEVTP